MFFAAVFTIGKIWEQPKCSLMDKWIKKMWYIYNGIFFSHKEEYNIAICDNMDRQIVYYFN